MNMCKEFRLIGLYMDSSFFYGLFNVFIGKNHRDGRVAYNTKKTSGICAKKGAFHYNIRAMSDATLAPATSQTEDAFAVSTDARPSISGLESKKEAVIGGLTDYIRYTFHQLGAHSKEEAASAMGTIEHFRNLNLNALTNEELNQERKEIESQYQWLKMEGGISSQREKIEQAWSKLNEMLTEATKSNSRVISDESKKRWIKRFKDKEIGASSKIEFVNFQLPVLLTHAEKVAEKRKTLLKNKQIKNVTPAMVEDIASFFDEQKFLSMHYLERENLAAGVTAALAAAEKLPALYSKAKGILGAAVGSGAMGKNKVGKWMESLFKQERTPQEIEEILEGELRDYIGTWTKLRYRYDRLERQMDQSGVPPGFNRLSDKKFLDLDYFQRESYVEEAERSMNISLNGPSNRPIDQLKLRIRHELQVKDWESAEELMAEAWEIAEGEDIHELESMSNYLKQFRKVESRENAPTESITKTLEFIREAISEAPPSVQMLYIEAMQKGYNTIWGLTTQMYNLVWCHEHGYLDGHREEVLYEESFDETEDIVENGHRQYGLENINLDAIDDDKKLDAMRPYRNTWAPTLYHMNASNGSSRIRYLNELQGKNAARDYWSTLKIRDITYDKQAYLVKKVNWKLKSGMKKLKASGVAFTASGPPVFMN